MRAGIDIYLSPRACDGSRLPEDKFFNGAAEAKGVRDASLIKDVRDSFKSKGLEFVSLSESTANPKRSVLRYMDPSGKAVTKELPLPLSELEDVVDEIEALDPEELADYLLKL